MFTFLVILCRYAGALFRQNNHQAGVLLIVIELLFILYVILWGGMQSIWFHPTQKWSVVKLWSVILRTILFHVRYDQCPRLTPRPNSSLKQVPGWLHTMLSLWNNVPGWVHDDVINLMKIASVDHNISLTEAFLTPTCHLASRSSSSVSYICALKILSIHFIHILQGNEILYNPLIHPQMGHQLQYLFCRVFFSCIPF